VIEALEAQLGLRADWEKIARALITPNASWEQAVQIVEQRLGTSGFTILSKIEPGTLLRFSGKPTRATQYAIGNPLLAIQMIEHAKDTALYAPLWLVVYENRAGKAVVAYERFTSQLAKSPHPEIAPVAQLVGYFCRTWWIIRSTSANILRAGFFFIRQSEQGTSSWSEAPSDFFC
jgi:uncharacterized protein (DUF302 family)